MKKLISRLRNARGETLVEALVSILIFTLSSILLFSMLVSASNINRAARAADEDRQSQLDYAEAETSTDTPATVSISCPDLNSSPESTQVVSVYISRKEPGALFAFFRAHSAE